MSGYRLCDHVISEHNTLNFLECSLYCLRKPSHCKSINYKARKHQHPSNNCQLNNATKTTHPQNLLPDKNYDYYQPLEKPEKKIEKIKKVEEQEQVEEPVNYAKSCDDLYKSGKTTTGVYTIDPDGLGPFAVRSFAVRCDMETTSTSGRGWTIFQRRVDGSLSFYRKWYGYKIGFGDLSGEFWLGLDKIHRLTASGQNVLRVDLESFENEAAYAVYESFSVGNESNAYILNVGNYSAPRSQCYYRYLYLSSLEIINNLPERTGLLDYTWFYPRSDFRAAARAGLQWRSVNKRPIRYRNRVASMQSGGPTKSCVMNMNKTLIK
ncbi:Hypothetical predicted protein, partial [Paramuricea clavata]